MSVDAGLAKRLKEARKKAGLRAVAAAAELGVTRQTLSAWEREGRGQSPSDENIRAAAILYGVDVASLRYGDEDFSDFRAVDQEGPSSIERPVPVPAGLLRGSATRGRARHPANVQDFYLQSLANAVLLLESTKPRLEPALGEFYRRALNHVVTATHLIEQWSWRTGRSTKEAQRRMQDFGLLTGIMYELLRLRSIDMRADDRLSSERYTDPPIALAMDPKRLQVAIGAQPLNRSLHYFASVAMSTDRPSAVRWLDIDGNLMIEIDCRPDDVPG